MRFIKVMAQSRGECANSVDGHIVGFYDGVGSVPFYQASVDRFYNVQRLSAEHADNQDIVARIETFMSTATVDMMRMFHWNHRTEASGNAMELMTVETNAGAEVKSVRFRFLAPEGEMKSEVTLSPETDIEKNRRVALENAGAKVVARGKKKRRRQKTTAVGPAILDTSFMDRLCKSYLATGW
ncbi:hypothetical protein [Pseudomonas fluorescens]|uniref:Uncharacterized protein n=1 Tax=Pseudomonas fluorescens TaxID=294 RepID=A0A5E6R314_PSEFL|nr:hypothetical protein [Pseudomonas fluorescens]VVM62311.1 hypothetical protein PS655_01359 [Pseudomonas fluorescens]